jgi:hypothetical protein
MIWLVQLVFDCRDPDPVMQFWGCALGYRSDLIGLATAGELVRLGATACGSAGDLLDPEGNEFCVVPAAAGGQRRLRTIVFDALDPGRLLGFWSAATGYPVAGSQFCLSGRPPLA